MGIALNRKKTLDEKLSRILADPSCGDFIIADAKDADMAGGMAAPGKSPEHHSKENKFRTLQEYRDIIRKNVKQGLVDIMLMSASTNEVLTIHERLFDDSHVTPAARANDTTDIHLAMGGVYASEKSRPFRSATIDHIMCGEVDCRDSGFPGGAKPCRGADLGLYSITFNNDLERDLEAIDAYKQFRMEAERKGFRHFLEIFNPNDCGDACPTDLGRFINDNIVRTLAGVVGRGRPVFLKIPYHGPEAMEQLAGYDRSLVVGILGGSSGTTFDAFHQLWEAKKYGARVALYGRMINNSEHQLTFIQHLRWLADGDVTDPAQAVRSYHASLDKLNIRAYRPLADDLVATSRGSNYGEVGGARKTKPVSRSINRSSNRSSASDEVQMGEPDFDTMTPAEKIAWNRAKRDRVFG